MNNIGSRYKKMDDFLKEWRDIALENPNCSFSTGAMHDAIYKRLVRIGIDSESQKRDISNEGMFDRWISRFKNQPNINVFVENDWRYFCQFTNNPEVFDHGRKEAIKIYVPLDIEHLEQGANQIFDFLAAKNISHASKIGKHLRVDNIVIRVSNEEDAKEVLNFINKNKYIQEGLCNPNPFAYNNGKISMTCDRNLSYNNTIASLIATYIDTRKKQQNLRGVKLSDFVRFVAEYHKDRFQQFNNEDQTLKDFEIAKSGDEWINSAKLINLRDITTLFLESTGIMYSYNNYLQHFKRSNLYERQVNDLTNIRKSKKVYAPSVDEDTVDPDMLDDKEFDLERSMFEMIDAFKAKNYTKEHMLKVLEVYLQTGDKMYLTSQNDLRERISSTPFREEIQKYMIENRMSLEVCFEKLLEKREQVLLENAVWTTYSKYQRKFEVNEVETDGKDWVVCALKGIAYRGKYNGFTQDKNARKGLMDFEISGNKAIEIMKRKTFSHVNDYSPPEMFNAMIEDYANIVINSKTNKQKHSIA